MCSGEVDFEQYEMASSGIFSFYILILFFFIGGLAVYHREYFWSWSVTLIYILEDLHITWTRFLENITVNPILDNYYTNSKLEVK